ncbi:hypothetical protein K7432_002971 [Basidiobolus ranarum]|uniref:Oxidoreductase-like domain-containing protein n=1 Tax=Basidiobolus ranarum TaxID=34480 RepID=A0ABR2W709_9FUNG
MSVSALVKALAHPYIRSSHRFYSSQILKKYGLPERPQEPTTCCMSGCANCVWDVFNDDIKEYNEAVKNIRSDYQAKGIPIPEELEQELSQEIEVDPSMKAFLDMEKAMKK